MDKVGFDEMRDALSLMGYEPRPYSGRGMYGKECLAVDINYSSEEWSIAQGLAIRFRQETDVPDTDSMGMGRILYWPSIEWAGPQPVYDEDDDNQPA